MKKTKNKTKKQNKNKNHLFKGCHPNANMNATHLFCPFKFKEMVLQRSTNSSLLFWRKPTHQIHDKDKIPNTG
jgi:hypothetical protein